MSRPGLRLGGLQAEQLRVEYQKARAGKDLDMASRIQGLLLVSDGMGERKAAQIVGGGRRTLQVWISKFRKGGLKALVKGPYPGRKAKLTNDQFQQLAQIIEEGPEQAGLDTGVWTAPLVARLVRKRFGVTYHPDHIGRILRRLGLSVQLLRRVLSRADEKEQSLWLKDALVEPKKSRRGVRSPDLRG